MVCLYTRKQILKKLTIKKPINPFSINIFKNKLCVFADITIFLIEPL